MNRVLVGRCSTWRGRRSLKNSPNLLEGRRRSAAGRTAPATGWRLASVSYGGEPHGGGACA